MKPDKLAEIVSTDEFKNMSSGQRFSYLWSMQSIYKKLLIIFGLVCTVGGLTVFSYQQLSTPVIATRESPSQTITPNITSQSTQSQPAETNPYQNATLPTGSCVCRNAIGALQLCPVFTNSAVNPYAQAAIQERMPAQDCFVTNQVLAMSAFTNIQEMQGGIIKFVQPSNGVVFYIYGKEIQY